MNNIRTNKVQTWQTLLGQKFENWTPEEVKEHNLTLCKENIKSDLRERIAKDTNGWELKIDKGTNKFIISFNCFNETTKEALTRAVVVEGTPSFSMEVEINELPHHVKYIRMKSDLPKDINCVRSKIWMGLMFYHYGVSTTSSGKSKVEANQEVQVIRPLNFQARNRNLDQQTSLNKQEEDNMSGEEGDSNPLITVRVAKIMTSSKIIKNMILNKRDVSLLYDEWCDYKMHMGVLFHHLSAMSPNYPFSNDHARTVINYPVSGVEGLAISAFNKLEESLPSETNVYGKIDLVTLFNCQNLHLCYIQLHILMLHLVDG